MEENFAKLSIEDVSSHPNTNTGGSETSQRLALVQQFAYKVGVQKARGFMGLPGGKSLDTP